MKYRRLGKNGLQVSEVSLGGWLTQGRTLDHDATREIVHRAFDIGINFFDTADAYARGEGEIALGKAIADLRRDHIVVASKCYWPMSDSPNDQGLSRKHVTESVHASLKRLGLDYLDIFQFHRHDAKTPVEESVRAIDDLIKQGKVLYWGVSEWSAAQIADANHVARAINANPLISNQPQYSMLARDIEKEILPMCVREGMGTIVWSPLAQGALTGKYKPGQPPPTGSRGADEKAGAFMKDFLADDILSRVQQVASLASDAGVSLAQFSLAWCLRKPEISCVIVGATSTKQLDENAAASDSQINPALFAMAEEILAE